MALTSKKTLKNQLDDKGKLAEDPETPAEAKGPDVVEDNEVKDVVQDNSDNVLPEGDAKIVVNITLPDRKMKFQCRVRDVYGTVNIGCVNQEWLDKLMKDALSRTFGNVLELS
jgi:hypothetical protein